VADGFLDQLIDWRDFEAFVRDLYGRHPELDVEHNVTEIGKSGALRQTDVKFTHRAGGHTYVTIVECKRWKEKVGRDRLDVLASSMKDLNAAKGVMFTTAGYERGAEAYAKQEGIELFIVRDLTDEEWGRPGRVVSFWMHYYGGCMTNITTGPVAFMSLGDAPGNLKLDLQVGPGAPPNAANTLFSVSDGSPGPNLLTLLLEARNRVLSTISREQAEIFDDGAEGALKAFLVPVRLDLSGYPYRELRQEFGFGRLEAISMDVLVTILQSRFEHDRGARLDLALAVENFMTRQRQVVTRSGEAQDVAVFELGDPEDRSRVGDDAVLKSDTLMQIFLEAWVHPPPLRQPAHRATSVVFTLPSWEVAAVDEPRTPPAGAGPEASADAAGSD
jgi:hypothetical protein